MHKTEMSEQELRRARALIAVQREVNQHSYGDGDGDDKFYVVTILDSMTEISNVRIARIWDRGFPGFIISIPALRITMYVGCGRGLPEIVRRAKSNGKLTYNQWKYAHKIIEDYSGYRNTFGGTTSSFCMYCIWFHLSGKNMNEFPKAVDVCDIRENGLFPDM